MIPRIFIQPAKNRSQKRKLAGEMEKLTQRLRPMEVGFLFQLFEPGSLTYEQIYKHYHDMWNEEIDTIRKNRIEKYCKVNDEYFASLYAPIEKEK